MELKVHLRLRWEMHLEIQNPLHGVESESKLDFCMDRPRRIHYMELKEDTRVHTEHSPVHRIHYMELKERDIHMTATPPATTPESITWSWKTLNGATVLVYEKESITWSWKTLLEGRPELKSTHERIHYMELKAVALELHREPHSICGESITWSWKLYPRGRWWVWLWSWRIHYMELKVYSTLTIALSLSIAMNPLHGVESS